MSDTNDNMNNILGGIFIVLGVICGIMAFMKHKVVSKSKCDDDTTCFNGGGYCDTKLHKCVKYQKRYYLLIPAVISIVLGILIIYKNEILKTNIDGGGKTEIEIIQKMYF